MAACNQHAGSTRPPILFGVRLLNRTISNDIPSARPCTPLVQDGDSLTKVPLLITNLKIPHAASAKRIRGDAPTLQRIAFLDLMASLEVSCYSVLDSGPFIFIPTLQSRIMCIVLICASTICKNCYKTLHARIDILQKYEK